MDDVAASIPLLFFSSLLPHHSVAALAGDAIDVACCLCSALQCIQTFPQAGNRK